MPFQFSPEQIQTIEDLRLRAEDPNDPLIFADIYEYVGDLIDSDLDNDTQRVEAWLRGAEQANRGQGIFSDIIREYTQFQGLLRTGTTFSPVNLQQASNEVARRVVLDILNDPQRMLPSIGQIATRDATAVGDTLFSPLLSPLDTAVVNNAAWSGSVLFSALEPSPAQTNLLLTAGAPGQLDVLDDFKNVLFSFISYVQAYEAAVSQVNPFSLQFVSDLGDLLATEWDEWFNDTTVGSNPFSAAGNLVGLVDGTALEPVFRLIRQYGSNRILGDIISSYNGVITQVSDNPLALAADANGFFSGLDPLLQQSTAIQILPDSLVEIASLANGSESVRNALANLSAVSIGLASFAGRNLDLFDRSTGEGSITQQWISDRARMLQIKRSYDARSQGYGSILTQQVLPENDNFTFTDRTSNLVFNVSQRLTSDPSVLVDFGRDIGDTMDGGAAGDRLYGMGGIDIIDGAGGNDYLEGGNGNDTLMGGAGDDVLIGGAGNDTLEGGQGLNDRAEGGAGVDTYEFRVGDQGLTIFDADGMGNIRVVGHQASPYTFADRTITAIQGEPNQYTDDLGTRFQLSSSNTLTISFFNSDTITVENFTSGDLGITLLAEEAFDVPEATPGITTYNVDPIGRPQPEEIFGRYLSGINGWNSYGAVTNNTSPELINAASIGDISGGNTFFEVIGGPGDSYMFGDSGFNYFVDDGVADAASVGVLYGNDVLNGGDGTDWLLGSFGDDWLLGGDDDSADLLIDNPDLLYGGTSWVGQAGNSSDDHLFGGGGNDYQISNGGDDYSDGGSGDDEIYAGAGNDTLVGGDGNDILSGDTRLTQNPITVSGGFGAPLVFSFDGNFIDGEQTDYGNDTLIGGGGIDALYGGGGNDLLSGGDGNDYLQGDFMLAAAGSRQGLLDHSSDDGAIHGDDQISGGAGDDIAYGGGGDDVIRGDGGNDFLYGDWDENNTDYNLDGQFHGNDHVIGGAGNDVVVGNDGDDLLEGNEDNDLLFGGDGNDILLGGSGDDQLSGNLDDDTLDGGAGIDLLFGDEGDDELFGGDGADQLVGGADNDRLSGGSGDDQLFGNDGNDFLVGGDGRDTLQAGAGDDTLFADSGGDLLFGGDGTDTYVVSAGAGAVQITDTGGASVLSFGSGISLEGISVIASNGLVLIDFGQGDSIATNAETFSSITTIEFADDTSIDPAELFARFTPGSSPGFSLGGDASVEDVSYSVLNNDLILEYSGADADWVDTTSLSSNNVLFREGIASDFGLPGSQPVLVLVNWLNGPSGAYSNQISDTNGGFLALPPQDQVARTFIGSDNGGRQEGGDASDVLVGGANADVLDGGEGNDDYVPGAGTDLMIDIGGDDVYRIEQGSGQKLIIDSDGSADRVIFGVGIDPASIIIGETENGLLVTVGDAANGNSVTIAEWSNSANTIETFEFADGTEWDLATIEANIIGNRSPDANGNIADIRVRAGSPLSLTLPADLFIDPNGDALTINISGSGNAALPDWLSYDPATRVLSGTPTTNDLGSYDFTIEASDPDGLSQSIPLTVHVPSLLEGTNNNDGFSGDSLPNDIFGFDGNDVLVGEEGDDFIDGGAGDDFIVADEGHDILIGGPGNDTIVGETDGDTYVFDLGDGTDLLRFAPFLGSFDDTPAPENTIRFGAGIQLADVANNLEFFNLNAVEIGFLFRLSYNPADPNDVVEIRFNRGFGNVGSSTNQREWFLNTQVAFDSGETTTLGALFDQRNMATDGNDLLFATDISPNIDGGAGDDEIFGAGGFDSVLFGGEGNDVIEGTVNAEGDFAYVLDGGAGDDTLLGSDAAETLIGGDGSDALDGGSGLDMLFGNAGDDTIDGGSGNDTIDGGVGADFLDGGSGDDIIVGGAGDDVLIGNRGDDLLQGGDGDDVYFTSTITTVPGAGDRVQDNVGFNSLNFGFQSSTTDSFDQLFGVSRSGDDLVIDQLVNFGGVTTVVDWFANTANRIDRILINGELGQVVGYTPEQIEGLVNGINTAPIVNSPLVDQQLMPDALFTYTFQSRAFADTQPGAGLTYSAQLLGGGALPTWLTFDDTTRTFSGTPPLGSSGQIEVVVTASDPQGLSITDTVLFDIASDVTVIDGTAGDDVLNGTSGADLIRGLEGNDTVNAGNGDDQVFGGIGNDTLRGDGGDDQLFGEAGDDLIVGGDGADTIDGGDGADDIRANAGDDIVFAGDGDDVVIGQGGADTIQGDGGNDNIDGGGGADTLFGGDGIDTISGGGGGDDIFGGLDDDALFGGDGNDELHGEAGNDTVNGEAGRDRLFGGDGDDILSGGEGDDVIEGGAGADTLTGGLDNDTLRGDEGDDMLFGEAGNDLLVGGNGADTIDGGDGVDDIRGNAGDDIVFAGAGDDIVIGQGGADTIQGDAGNDNIDGGGGADTLFGGEGSDTIAGAGGGDDIFGGLDDDMLFGGDGNDELHGEEGNDNLSGDAGRDRLFGEDGDDVLSGGAGDDVVEGGLGADTIMGGLDNDTLRGNEGDDMLFGEAGDDLLVGGDGADTIDGGDGIDDIRANAGDDIVFAGAGDDIVVGQGGADTIQGDGGNDNLDGGGGADTIFGGDGDDVISGGGGADVLSGGNGSDIYEYDLGDGNDTIDNLSTDSAADLLRIGSGVTTDQLAFNQVGDDLEIAITGQAQTITVQNWFVDSNLEVDSVETSTDGVVITAAEINALIMSGGGSSKAALSIPGPVSVAPSELLSSFWSAQTVPVDMAVGRDVYQNMPIASGNQRLQDNAASQPVTSALEFNDEKPDLQGSGPKLSMPVTPVSKDPDHLGSGPKIAPYEGPYTKEARHSGSGPKLTAAQLDSGALYGDFEAALAVAPIDASISFDQDEIGRIASQLTASIASLPDPKDLLAGEIVSRAEHDVDDVQFAATGTRGSNISLP